MIKNAMFDLWRVVQSIKNIVSKSKEKERAGGRLSSLATLICIGICQNRNSIPKRLMDLCFYFYFKTCCTFFFLFWHFGSPNAKFQAFHRFFNVIDLTFMCLSLVPCCTFGLRFNYFIVSTPVLLRHPLFSLFDSVSWLLIDVLFLVHATVSADADKQSFCHIWIKHGDSG